MVIKRKNAMPLKKGKNAGKIRPYVVFDPQEYKEISRLALELDMEKGEFIRAAVLHVVKNKIDPRKK
ncbi:MAG: hypothetical protein A2W19_02050 [Spirochaetes bacterium RBG_16_49_21]|nr:MAG: hypothetical protein A2W19_02050 [Spirochaetes bacterium RBG_16_49_21]